MKQIRFLFALALSITLFIFLNYKKGEVPPLGKFMNPFMGFWQNGELDEIDWSESLSSDRISAEVTVHYDEQGVPHIFAENDYDLYYAQGYVTARDRLWQMEFQIIAAEGRVSEIIGEKTLEFDRMQRRKGLKYGAHRTMRAVEKNPIMKNALQAYADGINDYIDELGYKDYPIEYKLLDYVPEAWSPFKSILFLKYMSDDLSSEEADLEHTNARKLLGQEVFDFLYPEIPHNVDPIVPKGTQWDFDPITVKQPASDFPEVVTNVYREKKAPDYGSNNFAVDSSKTANGSVILANEMDLKLNLPSIWYVIQLSTPDHNVYGVSFPGAPLVIIGFNEHSAWGSTNSKNDVVDWYTIEFRDDKREEYRYDDMWLKTEKVIEKIKVRGGSNFYDTIVHTHYGPVMYDRNFSANKEKVNLAMKWTAHEETNDFLTFYYFDRMKNYDDYVDALRYHNTPAQNFLFASREGDIAIWMTGRLPIKWEGQGKFIMDGADSRNEWGRDIPFEHHPYVKNPDRGFISSANQHPVDSLYPYYMYDFNLEAYRNRRLNDRLSYMRDIRVKDMMRLQYDNYNYKASESLPVMLDNLDTASLDAQSKQTYLMLRQWDYFNEAKLVAPCFFDAWWDELYVAIWDELRNDSLRTIFPNENHTIYLMNNDSIGSEVYFDKAATPEVETLADLVNTAFAKALDKIERWKADSELEFTWANYRNSRINHLLRLQPFSFDHIEIGGGPDIVNAVSGSAGPSWRMVVELTDSGVKGWGVYPGSQTGNPGHPKYGHMIENWAKGDYFPLLFLKDKDQEDQKIIFTQRIKKD